MTYTELSIEERAAIEIGRLQGMSWRQIARHLNRSPSTIGRELQRNGLPQGRYATAQAQRLARQRGLGCRPKRKLVPGEELFDLVVYMLRKRYSLEQIAGKLRTMEVPASEENTSVARQSTTLSTPCLWVSCVRS